MLRQVEIRTFRFRAKSKFIVARAATHGFSPQASAHHSIFEVIAEVLNVQDRIGEKDAIVRIRRLVNVLPTFTSPVQFN